MSFEFESIEPMKMELESILKRDRKFGPLHQLTTSADDTLMLTWTPELRSKAKAAPTPYIEFMEEISDCLSNFGYCLEADEGASETERNNYFLIIPETEADFDDE